MIFFVSVSGAVGKTGVQGIRFASYKSHTRVVIDLSGPVKFSKKFLPDPDRIFFDLQDCYLSRKIKRTLSVKNSILKSVRIAQYDRNRVRVVFDLKNSKNFYAFALENPHRLVIDVYENKKSVPPLKNKNKKKPLIKEKKKKSGPITVVIDPGHGGKDPGAIGPNGLREKDITLSVARKLGRKLKAKYGTRILYTRTKDKFVPLNERTEMANANKADLFVSIHVNASRNRRARGVETYFLNWTNDREATRVAARENRISYKKMRQAQSGLQAILKDLARNSKKEESMRLAHNVQNSMVSTLKKDYRSIKDLGVKYALFYVLVGAEMPSILVEISFISNRDEERRLASERYRNRVAEAIARGIDSYMSQSTVIALPERRPGVHRPAGG